VKFRRNAPQQGRQRLRRPPEGNEPSAAAAPVTYQPRRRGAAIPEAAKTRNFWLQRLGLVVLLVAVVASLVNVLSLSPHAKVLPLNSGQALTLHSQAEYEAAADKFLSQSIWNRNKITVDANSISRQMRKQFPELTDVSVTIPLLARRPVVYVEPAKPALILSTPTNGSYVLNSAGKALVRGANPAALNQPGLPVLTDPGTTAVTLNKQVLPASVVEFIQTVTAQLEAKGYTVSGIDLSSGGTQLDVHLAGEPYYVKFNPQGGDARLQAGTLLATVKYLKDHGDLPAHYVDVRIDGRAYYQ
jgi:hypothetical protein